MTKARVVLVAVVVLVATLGLAFFAPPRFIF
jgi:uncharacterized protein involved in exopolysaccharide biosynthesis